MMDENDYVILEPRDVAASGHTIHDWTLRLCMYSSIAISFGLKPYADPTPKSDLSQSDYISIGNSDNAIIPQAKASRFNSNTEIKDRLTARLLDFKSTLKEGWNGGNELPMEELSVANALAAVEAATPEELKDWTVFPSPNGTILFSPTNDLIGGISIGNVDFSYAAIGGHGQEIKGKELFSVTAFLLAIRLINSLNKA